MKDFDFSKINKVYFVGIGGIGISAIAKMMLLEGKEVSGSDISLSKITEDLEKAGATITKGQNIKDIPSDLDLIIYTAAIEVADKKLFEDIKKLKIPSLSYSEALGIVSRNKKTIAISGTHGKTTTTSMIAKIIMDAKFDPSVIVGSILLETNTNYVAGKGEYLIVEADEYRRSFLNLHPHILVINNIDADHLDYYKNLADVQVAFIDLIKKVPSDGLIITDINNKHITPLLENTKATVIDYMSVDISDLELPFPGEHNKKNAKVAISVATALGIKVEDAKKSLSEFRGSWRRFEYKGKMKSGAILYDDYAHNPQKVRACLNGAREMYPDKKIIAVFEPHLFSRTKTLLEEFAVSFNDADTIVLLPIYPAREDFDPTINSKMLGEKLPNIDWILVSDFKMAEEQVKKIADKNSVVILIGAGDVYKLSEKLLDL